MTLSDRRYKDRRSAGATLLRLIAEVWATLRRWVRVGRCFTDHGCEHVPPRGIRSCRFKSGKVKARPGKEFEKRTFCVCYHLLDRR